MDGPEWVGPVEPIMEQFTVLASRGLTALGMWLGYRLVNWPRFADFLIAVEAEMNKVSWPKKSELYRASMVVIFTMAFLALLLFCYDAIWQLLFDTLGVS